ncbi:MAG: helix-turn-helix transcriptional regulator [Saprospiraceae bacterium]|nr:helix-turn-helix transcriptional regulator [Saprospiraceae bacterium]
MSRTNNQMEKENQFFGHNVKFLRKKKKLTLVEMSNLTGISKSALSDYENNKSTPGLEILRIFSSFFSLSIDEILKVDVTRSSTNSSSQTEKTILEEVESSYENLDQEKYQFHLKLLHQRLESATLRFQMLQQLLQSKESENKTLRINIKLLEEKTKVWS